MGRYGIFCTAGADVFTKGSEGRQDTGAVDVCVRNFDHRYVFLDTDDDAYLFYRRFVSALSVF